MKQRDRFRFARAAALLAALVVLLAACAGDDDDAAPSSSTSEPTTVTSATTTSTTAPATSTTAPPSGRAIDVFLLPASTGTDCSEVVAAPRVASDEGVLRSALTQLLAGPSDAEQAAGLRSWFSADTAGMLNTVAVEQRTARVDFDDFSGLMPNASTSCGSTALLAQLDRTVLQFETVDRAVYSFDGSTTAFYEWLQLAAPAT